MQLAAWGSVLSLVLAVVTGYLLWSYARKDSSIPVLITVAVSWFLCLCVCLLLPIDLMPEAHDTMSVIWNVIYWFSFALMWLVIPLQQGYVVAGEFTVKTRLIASAKSNLKFYAVAGVLFAAFLIYVAAKDKLGGDEVLGFAVCLSNTWGITLSVLLLGYGLVEVPRMLWHSGDRQLKLRYAQHKTAKLDTELNECREELKRTIGRIRAVDRELTPSHHLREPLSVVEAKIPTDDEIEHGDGSVLAHGGLNGSNGSDGNGSGSGMELGAMEAGSLNADYKNGGGGRASGRAASSSFSSSSSSSSKPKPSASSARASRSGAPIPAKGQSGVNAVNGGSDEAKADASLSGLVELHYQLKDQIMSLQSLQSQYTECVDTAFALEDLIAQSKSDKPPASLPWRDALRWRWHVHWQPRAARVAGAFAILLSVVLVWCEMTMLFTQNLSPLSQLFLAVASNAAAVQFTCLVPLFYLQTCAMFSLFRLRISQFYYLDAHHRTNENSLLYNASYAMRCVVPLALNFLYIIRAEDTAFQGLIGAMQVVPFLGNSFNTYFPVVIAVFCGLTLCNVFGRILKLLNIPRFDYSATGGGDAEADDMVTEGKMLLRQERRRRGIKTDEPLL